MNKVFMSRQPLLNRQSRIIASRLTLHLGEDQSMQDAATALDDIWTRSEKSVFISCGARKIDAGLLDWSAPENAAIEIPAAALLDADGADLIGALQTWQPTACLLFDAQATKALAVDVPFRFIGFDAQQFTLAQLKLLAARTRSYGMGIAFDVRTSEDFRACMDAGMTAAAGWFFTAPTRQPAKTLNPAQTNIVRVLNLVRQNGEIRDIEAALKHDVAMSYKLLRYINSAGFGLSCEIQSFRHAVNMLGYDKLNRWLSLLLATASKDPMAPALMYTAVLRGRLMELLSAGLVDKAEYDNLFITGAFSLLDVLLGVSMEQALDAMRLPDPICDALLGNGGRYQPFLELALSSEGDQGERIAEQAAMLGLTADQFNRAQLQAQAFAEAMEF
ncbi:HDOD domain-containing protein [Candidatus Accumulibacter sp. ACC005]|jgi:c-di-GMP-related signal transduction protein|uniref:EAL and HDOD domain-containing protein n=2 Tax=unclassified Candidatus Accumulibacter TaxID=2619054 RepID=UPI0025BC9C19|nr:HDOD domain-containing protein [Candidatus Accumulibacter sp. ACC005]